jgi:hypothetical protein
MIYAYKCECGNQWEDHKKLCDFSQPSYCKCGEEGAKVLFATPSFFRKTHPDIKQDMHELIAGEPASNFTEI